MRVAIVGSGAAAFGVLDYLRTIEPLPDITLIDRGQSGTGILGGTGLEWSKARLRSYYTALTATQKRGFPPPKTNFGATPAVRTVDGWGNIWDSLNRGGLLNFWGLSALPYTDDDLKGWPIARADLDRHYDALARQIGITGQSDALDIRFGNQYATRSPVDVSPLLLAFEEAVNGAPHLPHDAYRFVAGRSRLALETNPSAENSCVYCGECMLGCPRGAMFSSVPSIVHSQRSGRIKHLIAGQVLAIDLRQRTISLSTDGKQSEIGPFDRVYLCAGCLGTTEIAMRSLGMETGPVMIDNAAYSIPIVSFTPRRIENNNGIGGKRYFSLSNTIVGAIPQASDGHFALIQVYPIFDHLWRHFVPAPLWPFASPFGRLLRQQFLLARPFLHGDYSQRYSISVMGDKPAQVSLAKAPSAFGELPGLWSGIRKVFGREGFWVPPISYIGHKTSSHYAATMPMGGDIISRDGALADGIYLCDSSVFFNAPATSPTFTIMANARRIAEISLQK